MIQSLIFVFLQDGGRNSFQSWNGSNLYIVYHYPNPLLCVKSWSMSTVVKVVDQRPHREPLLLYLCLYLYLYLYLYIYLYLDLAVDSSEGRDQCAHTEPLQLAPQPPHWPNTLPPVWPKLFSQTNLAAAKNFCKKGHQPPFVASCSWTLNPSDKHPICKLVEMENRWGRQKSTWNHLINLTPVQCVARGPKFWH